MVTASVMKFGEDALAFFVKAERIQQFISRSAGEKQRTSGNFFSDRCNAIGIIKTQKNKIFRLEFVQ